MGLKRPKRPNTLYPVTGSFSRSSINNSANVASPMSGLVTSVLIILSLLFLTEVFQYIPTPSLAAIVIVAAGGMFNWNLTAKTLFTGPVIDRVVFFVTFGVSLYQTAWGIVIGTVFQALVLLCTNTWPKIDVRAETDEVVFYFVRARRSFNNAKHLKYLPEKGKVMLAGSLCLLIFHESGMKR